jgi:DNA-directed RNA polymerase subunit RPC12/RpoP
MPTITYKCPSCASPLTFDGNAKEMTCSSCGNTFEVEGLKEAAEIEKQAQQVSQDKYWDIHDEAFSSDELKQAKTYSCSSCGAQLITDDTTVSTECAFCGSPSIIPDQFTPGTRPQNVLPFKIEKEKAEKLFSDYFKNKKLLPNIFKSDNRINEIHKLYVPYWLFNCKAFADIQYKATKVRTFRRGDYRITQTRHYLVRRAGTVDFKDLPINSSRKADSETTESLEPYNMDEGLAFTPAILSGAQASRADISAEESKKRADERIASSMQNTLRSTVVGYSSVIPTSTKLNIPKGMASPTLFPMWIITTNKDNKTYTFAINGQTGKLTCDVPISVPKAISWFIGISAISLAIIALIMYFVL